MDAARYFLLAQPRHHARPGPGPRARAEPGEPVYYVQYAHARIASILRKANELGATALRAGELAGSAEELHPSARSLVKRLLELPASRTAAERRAPHRLTAYCHEVAQEFSAFYRDCRVVGAAGGGRRGLPAALTERGRAVIAGSLDLLGVSAPEQM